MRSPLRSITHNPRPNHTIRLPNVHRTHAFHRRKAKVGISIFCTRIMRIGNGGNKNCGRRLSSASGHSFPLPRAWPFVKCGAADMPSAAPELVDVSFGPFFGRRSSVVTKQTCVTNKATQTNAGASPTKIRRAAAHFLTRVMKRDKNLQGWNSTRLQFYKVACRSLGLRSRWRALRPKNIAWLTTADTTATWKGFAIRKAGSGRCPVRNRSG